MNPAAKSTGPYACVMFQHASLHRQHTQQSVMTPSSSSCKWSGRHPFCPPLGTSLQTSSDVFSPQTCMSVDSAPPIESHPLQPSLPPTWPAFLRCSSSVRSCPCHQPVPVRVLLRGEASARGETPTAPPPGRGPRPTSPTPSAPAPAPAGSSRQELGGEGAGLEVAGGREVGGRLCAQPRPDTPAWGLPPASAPALQRGLPSEGSRGVGRWDRGS